MSIEQLLSLACQKKASDLHLVTNLAPIIRVDGNLIQATKDVISTKDMQKMIFSLLNADQQARLQKDKELDFSHETQDGNRFRINAHYEKGNLGMVARIISHSIPTLDAISVPDVVHRLLQLQQGLILVTGPTGCGKSTTLASMIETINKEQNRNIITLEDPIEFLFQSKKSIIIQRQLGVDMLSFKSALKHIVRQDPDVIMVGEMRDLETIAATITLAETGHLVLATLHTYSAAQTIDRIIDIFPPHQQSQVKAQLSSVLSAIISQRLLAKQDGGRIAAREILLNNPAVANLIRENKISQIKTVMETNAKNGMITIEKALKNLYKDGLISKEEMNLHLIDLMV